MKSRALKDVQREHTQNTMADYGGVSLMDQSHAQNPGATGPQGGPPGVPTKRPPKPMGSGTISGEVTAEDMGTIAGKRFPEMKLKPKFPKNMVRPK